MSARLWTSCMTVGLYLEISTSCMALHVAALVRVVSCSMHLCGYCGCASPLLHYAMLNMPCLSVMSTDTVPGICVLRFARRALQERDCFLP
jgi:hypothetical protein